jgi:hypothetical protein
MSFGSTTVSRRTTCSADQCVRDGGGPENKRPRRYERQPPKVISPSRHDPET